MPLDQLAWRLAITQSGETQGLVTGDFHGLGWMMNRCNKVGATTWLGLSPN